MSAFFTQTHAGGAGGHKHRGPRGRGFASRVLALCHEWRQRRRRDRLVAQLVAAGVRDPRKTIEQIRRQRGELN